MIPSKLMNNVCQILKRAPGSHVKGIWVPGQITSIQGTKCSIQPVSSRDIQILPEGDRDKVLMKIYFAEPQPLGLNDTIRIDNVEYKILQDNIHDDAPFLRHSRVFIGRMD